MINCAVNPQCGRERAFALEPVLKKKRVAVVGGGPAGCEAGAGARPARPCAGALTRPRTGSAATSYPAARRTSRRTTSALARWYENTLKDLGVEVHLNTAADAAMLRDGFDAVIIATGSRPKRFELEGGGPVYTAAEVLLGEKDPGRSAVVVGGGLVGCETAALARGVGQKGDHSGGARQAARRERPALPREQRDARGAHTVQGHRREVRLYGGQGPEAAGRS